MTPRLLSRRAFLRGAGNCGLLVGGAGLLSCGPLRRLCSPPLARAALAASSSRPTLEDLARAAPIARYWASTQQADATCATCHDAADFVRRGLTGAAPPATHQHNTELVKCLLCARGCALKDGQRGECGARVNSSGRMRSLVYGRPIAIHVDPIEKKPFFHFLPGSRAYSLATAGCPLHCEFCQNWEISQSHPEDHPDKIVTPEEAVSGAVAQKAPVIAFTYNEPTVFTEYLTDIARAARPRGIRSVIVSCGYMNEAPLSEMCDVLDAIKIDLKGFAPDFYRKVSHAELEPVLRSIKQVARSGRHLELVNLVVPTLNDSDAMLRGLAQWVSGELGPDVPVHFTRFHPDYRMLNLPPTPIATLERARAFAQEAGLRYAYVGNVPGHPGEHTYCPQCGKVVIRRESLFVTELNLREGRCRFCGTQIAGVWS